jgi:hypothetical protein
MPHRNSRGSVKLSQRDNHIIWYLTMEALISEILKTIPSYTGPIVGTILTLFATQKYEQLKQENARRQVPPNEHIKLVNLKFMSVPIPTKWSFEWWRRWLVRIASVLCILNYFLCSFLALFMFQAISFPVFLNLLALAILSLLLALKLSVGLHREGTEDQPIAEIEMSGSCEQIDAHMKICLNALKAKPQGIMRESKTLIYKFDYGRFIFSRMLKLEYEELGNDHWKLRIQCGIYDRDFQVCKEKTSGKDELNLKEFIAILNISSLSTEKIGKLGTLHGVSQAKVEHKDVLPLIHTQVPDNLTESIRFGHDQK